MKYEKYRKSLYIISCPFITFDLHPVDLHFYQNRYGKVKKPLRVLLSLRLLNQYSSQSITQLKLSAKRDSCYFFASMFFLVLNSSIFMRIHYTCND